MFCRWGLFVKDAVAYRMGSGRHYDRCSSHATCVNLLSACDCNKVALANVANPGVLLLGFCCLEATRSTETGSARQEHRAMLLFSDLRLLVCLFCLPPTIMAAPRLSSVQQKRVSNVSELDAET